MVRTMSGENIHSTLTPEITNEVLLEQTCEKLANAESIFLIHDPSDIRKPYSSKTENLGSVRDLEGKIINGYSTHNTVAISSNDKSVHLISHLSYSNKDANFLSMDMIRKLEKSKSFEGSEEAAKLYKSNQYFNKKSVSIDEITKTGLAFKNANPSANITHILDREYDDDDYIQLIYAELSQDFVIRAKKSRMIDVSDDLRAKISEVKFEHHASLPFQKMSFGKQCIQDGHIKIQWSDFGVYTGVKITILNKDGDSVFGESMYLITSKTVNNIDDAYKIYLTYLKRSKIEYVFKFLKDGMGWEEIQIRDFKSIQQLLSLCFYVSSYLYEIGEEEAHDDCAVLLAEIGGGKGKVTRHFISKGIQRLLSHYRVDGILKKRKSTIEQESALRATFEIVL